jgi:hypothetical protein
VPENGDPEGGKECSRVVSAAPPPEIVRHPPTGRANDVDLNRRTAEAESLRASRPYGRRPRVRVFNRFTDYSLSLARIIQLSDVAGDLVELWESELGHRHLRPAVTRCGLIRRLPSLRVVPL